jgi:5-methyltetrahydropteroyltriglutamate--homocysteine methyltransferase
MSTIKTASYGYPRIGDGRELKKSLETYWAGKINGEEFLKEAEALNASRLKKQKEAGVDFPASNDFSFYDGILDLSFSFGIIPQRFAGINDRLKQYFAAARGSLQGAAAEMTKWFDTNYHYIVPEITGKPELRENIALKSYLWAKNTYGVETIPSITGPFTFLKLSKGYKKENFGSLLNEFAAIYNVILKQLQNAGAAAARLEEPALVLNLTDAETEQLLYAYKIITKDLKIEICVQTYYESLSRYKEIAFKLPVQALGLDFTVNSENLENVREYGFPKDKKLVAGVVSGRDVWKTDYKKTAALIKELFAVTGKEEITISNSSPLFHLPISLKHETALDKHLLSLLSFADERLEELATLKEYFNAGKEMPAQDFESVRKLFRNEAVRKTAAAIDEAKTGRKEPFQTRRKLQNEILILPLFPTTTIGSYPQTAEVRKNRRDLKKGLKTRAQYEEFIKEETKKVIALQEELELDVLVHGEFERNDMVEYFGEHLGGFAFTCGGWVQSYGSRCVKPPLIYGDVYRPAAITVKDISYAQSLTQKPLKGMLTGPVTILNWSFFRKDISKKDVAFQIALALADEVLDLEKAGIKIIQIDEAAFREGLPLKKEKQAEYLDWAVKAFKLTNSGVKPQTQIHTHMCYSEFNEILGSIYAMDSDVISIEASRSGGEIIAEFEKLHYDHAIGLGVYDIHSPRVPLEEEILLIVERSVQVIDKNLFWINPDCGLKTRGYAETIPSLRNMVAAARKLREKYR